MDELKVFAALRPDEQLSDADLADLFAELFPDQEPSGSAQHRVVMERSDARTLESVVVDRSRPSRRPVAVVAVAAAVVAVFGVGGLVMLDDRDRPHAETATSQPASSIPAAPASPTSPALMAISPLLDLVEPFVPEGFSVLYASGPPPAAVAYNQQGVRLEVTVDLDQADNVRDQIGDQLVETAEGRINDDGTMLLSTDGDVIQATFSFGGCPCEIDILDEYRPLASQLVTGVAGALDETRRAALRDFQPPPMGTAELRAAVAAAMLATNPDMNITSERVVGPWDFNMTIGDPGEPGSATTLTVEAIRAEDARLVDGVARTSERTAVATRWLNGWQLVAGSITPAGETAAVDTSQLNELLADIEPLFADWTNSAPTDQGCATHQVVMGDSIDSIAERYDTTIEALTTVNADLNATANRGSEIAIPCPATPAMPSDDQTGLDSFQHSFIPSDFEPFTTIRFATDGYVYVVTGGTDSQGGSVFTERFSRDSATSIRSTQAPVPNCPGPVEVVGPVIDPAAIETRCEPDGQRNTLDVFTSQTRPIED